MTKYDDEIYTYLIIYTIKEKKNTQKKEKIHKKTLTYKNQKDIIQISEQKDTKKQ